MLRLQAPSKAIPAAMASAAAALPHGPAPCSFPPPPLPVPPPPGGSATLPDSGRTAQLNHTPRLQHATQPRSRVGNGVARPTRRIQHLPPKQEPNMLPQVLVTATSAFDMHKLLPAWHPLAAVVTSSQIVLNTFTMLIISTS